MDVKDVEKCFEIKELKDNEAARLQSLLAHCGIGFIFSSKTNTCGFVRMNRMFADWPLIKFPEPAAQELVYNPVEETVHASQT